MCARACARLCTRARDVFFHFFFFLFNFSSLFPADPALREAVIGVSPAEQEKHELYIDVQPMMGTALRARARMQINLAVSQVRDIKQVASFPDIVFPIMWFDDVSCITCIVRYICLCVCTYATSATATATVLHLTLYTILNYTPFYVLLQPQYCILNYTPS